MILECGKATASRQMKKNTEDLMIDFRKNNQGRPPKIIRSTEEKYLAKN